jgi:hypothetical protein
LRPSIDTNIRKELKEDSEEKKVRKENSIIASFL